MLERRAKSVQFKHFALQKTYSAFDTPAMYEYPRGAFIIVTVSPLWLFSWSLCYWAKMVSLCYFEHGKWCGKEKPIMLPNGQGQWSLLQLRLSVPLPHHPITPAPHCLHHGRPVVLLLLSEGPRRELMLCRGWLTGEMCQWLGDWVPLHQTGRESIFMVLTAVVIGEWLAGITRCGSISSKFPIKERLLGHCTKIACGFFI